VQPAISSNRLGIESKFQLSEDIPKALRTEILAAIGDTIPDYRFWIPTNVQSAPSDSSELTRLTQCCHTVSLGSNGFPIRRVHLLQLCLSLGFELDQMFIPQHWVSPDLKVSIACQTEPFNFHPRLLTEGNQIGGCTVTFTYSVEPRNSSVELMIISVICRTCGFARL
jgi:hypothetical protein